MRIKSEGVEKILGNQRIIKNIDIDIADKKFIGLIGPNGSEKSTLLKCLYRVLKPTEGVIWIDDEKLDELSMKASDQKIGVFAQHNYCQFDFSVEEMVLMGRSPHKKITESNNHEDYKIAKESLENVGMSAFINRSFGTLSGGEHQLQLMDIIKGLNVTVISAIHDLNIAAAYCDEIYVLKDEITNQVHVLFKLQWC